MIWLYQAYFTSLTCKPNSLTKFVFKLLVCSVGEISQFQQKTERSQKIYLLASGPCSLALGQGFSLTGIFPKGMSIPSYFSFKKMSKASANRSTPPTGFILAESQNIQKYNLGNIFFIIIIGSIIFINNILMGQKIFFQERN